MESNLQEMMQTVFSEINGFNCSQTFVDQYLQKHSERDQKGPRLSVELSQKFERDSSQEDSDYLTRQN